MLDWQRWKGTSNRRWNKMNISEIIKKEIDRNIHQMNRIKKFTQPDIALRRFIILLNKEKEWLDDIIKTLDKRDEETIFDYESDFKKRYSDIGYRRHYLSAQKERLKHLEDLRKNGLINGIKYYRLRNSWDQETLAEKAHTKQPAIARIENPKYNPTRKTLQKYARIFGVDAKELL